MSLRGYTTRTSNNGMSSFLLVGFVMIQVTVLHNWERRSPDCIVVAKQIGTASDGRNRIVEEWVRLLETAKIFLAKCTCIDFLPPIVITVFIAYSTNRDPPLGRLFLMFHLHCLQGFASTSNQMSQKQSLLDAWIRAPDLPRLKGTPNTPLSRKKHSCHVEIMMNDVRNDADLVR